MAATMERAGAAGAYAAAVERKKATRRNVYRCYTVAEERQAWIEGRELDRSVGLYSDEFAEPKTLAEFCDDRVIEWGKLAGFPEAGVMVAVAAAARDGAGEAVKALTAARQLTPAQQWAAYRSLRAWPSLDVSKRLGVGPLVAALSAEWARLRLATEDPDAPRPRGRRALTGEEIIDD